MIFEKLIKIIQKNLKPKNTQRLKKSQRRR